MTKAMSERLETKLDALAELVERDRQDSREYRIETKERLEQILEQAKMTNGRVQELERYRAGHEEYSDSQHDRLAKLQGDHDDLKDNVDALSMRIWMATGAVAIVAWAAALLVR